ncbi:MAG: LysR family transcriptional regulator [Planctomycetia bacterium]|nr:LysR family transcriptional regulator [Planctomycetia bacterium]
MAARKRTKTVSVPGLKPKAKSSPGIQPRVKVWLEVGDEYVFGWGICEILLAVRETGAIKDAAARLGKSYRYVWGRVKDAEVTLQQPLVETRVGGDIEQRSSLTPLANQLVEDFAAFRARMLDIAHEEFASRFAALKPKVASARMRGRRT